MNYKLKVILRESAAIQNALLRVRNKEGQQSLQVKVAYCADNLLHCIIPGKIPKGMRLANKPVHLIQRHHDNYFFISGHCYEEVQEKKPVISFVISKACWFVRKKRGSVSWFREKYIYEDDHRELVQVAGPLPVK